MGRRPDGLRGGPGELGTLVDVSTLDEPLVPGGMSDDDRRVDLIDDDYPLLPEQTVDDTDRGWGDWSGSNDDRLLAERPPHWE